VNLSLLLPWLPVILAAGVGGRLLGRPRSLGLGIVCALFWIVLGQASGGATLWAHPMQIALLLTGGVAIVAMGAWAGEMAGTEGEVGGASNAGRSARAKPRDSSERAAPVPGANESLATEQLALTSLSIVFSQFSEWLEDHRDDPDPWPKFDEFLRAVMYQTCRATHVRPYRLLDEDEDLIPLRESEITAGVQRVSSRRGIVGHVVTTGRCYIAGDMSQGELVRQLADESEGTVAWCFAVTHGRHRIGLVTVGELGIVLEKNMALLGIMQDMVRLFWSMLCETCRSRSADTDDPVSRLLTREAFLREADQTIQEAYDQGEPVALAVIALEQLRQLNDTGRWSTADELVREVSAVIRQKVRAEDRLGRFDGSRFLVLLRRVDSDLATLILEQLVARLDDLCGDTARWRASIQVRCGLAGSGMEKPELPALISRAVGLCHRARREGEVIACDLRPTLASRAG
jgi:diguanylate cyclase (GGDEF)-like protein